MSMRQTVGGAQKVVTCARRIWSSSADGVEPRVVVDEDRRLGDPGREEARPRVLGPAGRADRQVHVTGPRPDPVHRRQVPDGVRHLRVLDQLGLAGRPRGEVEQQRVGRRRRRLERPWLDGHRRRRTAPSPRPRPRRSAGTRRTPRRTSRCQRRWRRPPAHRPGPPGRCRSPGPSAAVVGMMTAPILTTASIVSHSSTWLPSISRTRSPLHHTQIRQPRRHLVGPGRHLVEAESRSEPSSSTIQRAVCVVAAGDDVEPVDGPVEPVPHVGPAELRHGPVVLPGEGHEGVAGAPVGRGAGLCCHVT